MRIQVGGLNRLRLGTSTVGYIATISIVLILRLLDHYPLTRERFGTTVKYGMGPITVWSMLNGITKIADLSIHYGTGKVMAVSFIRSGAKVSIGAPKFGTL